MLNNASGLGAVVAGGGIWLSNNFLINVGNRANGTSASIGGGALNSANGAYSAVGGGYQNTAGNAQFNSGNSPVVAGGYQNTASADFSVVSGGTNNVASGVGSVIGGGLNNSTTNDYATVGGGYQNTAGGGFGYATVGGGYQNTAGGTYSTVGGGANSTASGGFTTVAGGYFNSASGTGATVAGGVGNVASGAGSFAAGQDAQSGNSGAFVWSDGSATTTSSANNQFVSRASGGYVFYTSSGASGAQLPAGSGSWSSLSDRNTKNDFAPVNSQAVLAQVASLPLTTWSYSTERGVRHLGPMAQDFFTAFGVGEDERHIADVDEGGVALAAIQGLNQKLEDKAATIAEQSDRIRTQAAEIEQLKQNVTQLQTAVAQLSNGQSK